MNQPSDSNLAQWMRDTIKQAVEDAEHDPDAGEGTYIGTMILAGETTHVSDASPLLALGVSVDHSLHVRVG
jgi:hypothetical protein